MTITVISADSSNGASTSDTSSARRSATNKITVIATRAAIAAERNEPTMVALVASIVTAAPPASGATAVTSATNSGKPLLLCAAAFGRTWMRARPSGSTQSRARCRRNALQGHRLGRERGAQLVELRRQKPGQRLD